MNEADTRPEHIDPALKAAGWGVLEGRRVLREYPITLDRIEGCGRARASEPQTRRLHDLKKSLLYQAFSSQL